MNKYPAETVEFQAITVTVDGTPVTTGVDISITVYGARPAVWVAATTLSGKIGTMISGLAIGDYQIWARKVSAPETVVILCGEFSIV